MSHRHPNQIDLAPDIKGGLDYMIDGRPLLKHLHSREHKDTDFVSPFCVQGCDIDANAAGWLLLRLKSPLPTQRVPLLFCPRCFDLGCGAITAVVECANGRFIWKDFGFETSTSEAVFNRDCYEHVRGFEFDENAYSALFSRYFVG